MLYVLYVNQIIKVNTLSDKVPRLYVNQIIKVNTLLNFQISLLISCMCCRSTKFKGKHTYHRQQWCGAVGQPNYKGKHTGRLLPTNGATLYVNQIIKGNTLMNRLEAMTKELYVNQIIKVNTLMRRLRTRCLSLYVNQIIKVNTLILMESISHTPLYVNQIIKVNTLCIAQLISNYLFALTFRVKKSSD